MTRNDIIEAAFRVWGRDFYRRTSLSQLAKELGVSKPALYRHFDSKNALTTAMTERFFDEFTASIRPAFEKAVQMEDPDKGLFSIIQAICGYYARNGYALIFSLINIYDRKLDRQTASEQIKARGTNMEVILPVIEKKYDIHPRMMHLSFATLTFYMANFHKTNYSIECRRTYGSQTPASIKNPPTEEQVNKIITAIYEVIKHGQKFSAQKIDNLDFERLEKFVESKMKDKQPEALFKAVAEAVAEAGPWEASMEMVAKKMGLSKSSLYGHFKNKKDMLHRLFMTEFKRIIDFARLGISLSSDTAEQLYLGIYSIAVYLRSRPEILIALDWFRTRRLDLGKPDKNFEFFRLFEDVDIESLRECNEEERQIASHWILFLLISVLMKRDNINKNDVLNIRLLFRFITLGLGGFIK